MYALWLVCLAPLTMGGGETKKYPRPDLLIEPGELATPQAAQKFRVLDARSAKEFTKARISNASNVKISAWSKQFASGQDPKTWEAELGTRGLDLDVPVVVYGDNLTEVARLWYILRYWGLKDVRILNGGFDAWVAGKYPVETQPYVSTIKATQPKLIPMEKRLATKDQIKDSLKDNLFQIVDARADSEYRAGAIPGCVNLEWKMLVDSKTQRFKGPAELEQVFKKAGIDLTKPTVAHCQSGGRSSVMVFAMELMGAADARNYYRSWGEWGNAGDTPIFMPKKQLPSPLVFLRIGKTWVALPERAWCGGLMFLATPLQGVPPFFPSGLTSPL
jgi:thiosulfate/3-mercaptopyruvate sulfurtransferase